MAYKNDAASTFVVTWGKHNTGIPDTLPVAVVAPVQGVEKKAGITLSQSPRTLFIRYFMLGENGTADVAMYNSSGRLVWSAKGKTLHKGTNEVVCPSDEFGAGVFIVKVAVAMDDGSRSVNSRTVVLGNMK